MPTWEFSIGKRAVKISIVKKKKKKMKKKKEKKKVVSETQLALPPLPLFTKWIAQALPQSICFHRSSSGKGSFCCLVLAFLIPGEIYPSEGGRFVGILEGKHAMAQDSERFLHSFQNSLVDVAREERLRRRRWRS